MFTLIKNKIINFFLFNKPKYEIKSSDICLDLKENNILEDDDLESLVNDLNELIDIGEFIKAMTLSRKYNFYNSYGYLIISLIENNNYSLAFEAVLDLIAGPFFHKVLLDLESKRNNEIFQTARILYLLKVIQEKLYSQKPDAFIRIYLDHYNKSASFRRFIKKVNGSLDIIGTNKNLSDELLRYAQIFDKKLKIYFDKNLKQYLYEEKIGLNEYNKSRDYKLYQVLDAMYTTNQINLTFNNEIIALSLNNLSDYIYNDGSNKYFNTLLKIDLQTIYNNVEILEYLDLSDKIGVYDTHPKLSLEYYNKGEYSKALDIIKYLYINSSLKNNSGIFFMERYKETLELFILHIISQLKEDERSKYYFFAEILKKDKYVNLIDKIIQEDAIVEHDSLNEFVDLSEQIFNNSKILITKQ